MTTSAKPIVPIVTEAEPSVAMKKFAKRIHWVPLIAIGFIHLVALMALLPAFFSWPAVIAAFCLHVACACGGITLGFHRLLTHRSFKTPKPVEYLLSWLGSLSWQGGPIQWVATHRLHHRYSDTDDDPHTPRHGFCWSHALWCFHYDPQFDEFDKYSRYAQDLARDRGHVFIERTTWLWQFVVAGALFGWGYWLGGLMTALSCVIWGTFVRLVYVYHITWFVNSASHVWGYRNYETSDGSRNLWWVGLLAFGEGWHNNHHAYPRSARHGLRFWEFDSTWLLIRLMSRLGLATDIRLPEKGASREMH